MNADTVRSLVRRAQGSKTFRAFADELRIDHAYLYRMMNGEREISDGLLAAFGLERVQVYRKKKKVDKIGNSA